MFILPDKSGMWKKQDGGALSIIQNDFYTTAISVRSLTGLDNRAIIIGSGRISHIVI